MSYLSEIAFHHIAQLLCGFAGASYWAVRRINPQNFIASMFLQCTTDAPFLGRVAPKKYLSNAVFLLYSRRIGSRLRKCDAGFPQQVLAKYVFHSRCRREQHRADREDMKRREHVGKQPEDAKRNHAQGPQHEFTREDAIGEAA